MTMHSFTQPSPFVVFNAFSASAPVWHSCDTCALKAMNPSDVELHKRAMHAGKTESNAYSASSAAMPPTDKTGNNAYSGSSARMDLPSSSGKSHTRTKARPHICRACGTSFKQKAHLGKYSVLSSLV